MGARAAIFLALAAGAGAAYAMRSRAAQGDGVESSGGDDVGGMPDFGGVAADVSDALGGIVSDQQHLSWDGLARLKFEEGFSATPYPDHKGRSIGYGHLIRLGEDLTYVTEEQATDMLAQDVAWAERAVRGAVSVPLTQNQFDALVSLAYNIGETAFRKSTLVAMLNGGDSAGAAAQFGRWVMASGQVNEQLVARRDRERQLFEA